MSPQSKSRGMTLVEVMVAMAAGILILASFLAITVNVAKSFKAVTNYRYISKMDRYTLDIMGRDIRMATHVTSSLSLTNRVDMTNSFGDSYFYLWDGSNNMTRSYTYSTNTSVAGTLAGTTTTTTLLTNCNSFSLSFLARDLNNNLAFTNAVSASNVKLIQVSWSCARSIWGGSTNSEGERTAQFTLRN
ncbi:MAG TPA: prepilin-type N-terminal cleavage/methylation domain-containing protein [Methylomirabilota bacterium]|nr:prepilin-type N-terminal cleavage/methylation domain-containing protein [Methylomirabilota bacterium]